MKGRGRTAFPRSQHFSDSFPPSHQPLTPSRHETRPARLLSCGVKATVRTTSKPVSPGQPRRNCHPHPSPEIGFVSQNSIRLSARRRLPHSPPPYAHGQIEFVSSLCRRPPAASGPSLPHPEVEFVPSFCQRLPIRQRPSSPHFEIGFVSLLLSTAPHGRAPSIQVVRRVCFSLPNTRRPS